jgi:hypothetical protein
VSNVIQLPPNVQEALNASSRSLKRGSSIPKIFIGLPNMTHINTALVSKLFSIAQRTDFEPWFHFISEVRHIDHARNTLRDLFLQTKCDYLWMIDEDVDVPINAIEMANLDKDIIAGLVFCWIKGALMPSIWERAECEQCVCLKRFLDNGDIHDRTQYRCPPGQEGLLLQRWNPIYESWDDWAIFSGDKQIKPCRCRGTGKDPFVFKAHHKVIGEPKLLECDSVGSACVMIARRVLEKVPVPAFRFLYKPSREILLTEDHYFCWKAKECGFEVWADPQIGCAHFKLVNLLDVNKAINQGFIMGRESAKVVALPEPEVAVATE